MAGCIPSASFAVDSRCTEKNRSPMKKIYSLVCALSLTAGLATAQVGNVVQHEPMPATLGHESPGAPEAGPEEPTDPAGFHHFKEGRVRLNLTPNPVVVRATLDAGGHAMQRVTITDSNGQLVRLYNDVNDTRLVIVRDDLQTGVHFIQAITTHGMGGIKMMVE